MEKFLKSLSSIGIILFFMAFQSGDVLCNAKELKEKAKLALENYKYDSSEMTRILYKNNESIKEIEVPLFIGEKYRMVFELEALPTQVEVQIYNKDKTNKNRKLLFSSKDMSDKTKMKYKDKNNEKRNLDSVKITQFQFEISKARHVYVNYIIPASEAGSYSGCAVFMVGYK